MENLEEEYSCFSASSTSGHQLKPRLSFPEIILLEVILESLICLVLSHVINNQVLFSSRVKEHNINHFSIFPAPKHNVSGPVGEDEVQQMVS